MVRSIRSLQRNRLSLNPPCAFFTSGDWQCPRVTTLYQAINCPIGHYKIPGSQFDQRGEIVGLTFPSEKGYSWYCMPCIKAFEVDVFEFDGTHETAAEAEVDDGRPMKEKTTVITQTPTERTDTTPATNKNDNEDN